MAMVWIRCLTQDLSTHEYIDLSLRPHWLLVKHGGNLHYGSLLFKPLLHFEFDLPVHPSITHIETLRQIQGSDFPRLILADSTALRSVQPIDIQPSMHSSIHPLFTY